MAFFAIVVPIIPGKTEATRAFTKEMMTTRHAEFKSSREEMGVVERTFLQMTPMGDMVIVTLEGDNPVDAFKKFGDRTDEFTNWFIEQVKELHGLDLRNLPDMPLPELVADSSA